MLSLESPSGELAFGPTDTLWKALEDYGSDQDLVESVAMDIAAMASLELISENDLPRRVVIAADAKAEEMPQGALGQVQIEQDITWQDVVSIHVDGAENEPLVISAMDNLEPEVMEQLQAEPLEWFDITEKEYLTEAFRG